jgi:hypothetical protein
MSTHLLFDLQLVHDRCQLRQDLVSLLVVFELGGDEIGKVAEGFGGVEDLISTLACAHISCLVCVLTFFMTPTASSVCPTNSSSACSIFALASSLSSSSDKF